MGKRSSARPVVLIFVPSFTAGGSEKQAVYYAKAIQMAGKFEPIFIGFGREGELALRMENEGFRKHHFSVDSFWTGNFFTRIKTILSLLFFVRSFHPRYLIALNHWPAVFCGLTFRFVGAKAFYWNQGSVETQLSVSKWEKLIARLFKPRYLANGQSSANFIAARHSIPRSKVSIIYNALEIPETIEKPSSETLNVVMLANFFPEKDHETVLRAFALIITESPNVRLHFIGGAPGQSPLLIAAKALAFDLGLSRNVQFHGVLADPQLILRQAHLGILSTLSEGFSNALMEYMAYGLPVVATDIPPNLEALGEANLPWLFQVQDVHGLANRMERLLRNESLRKEIGIRNRERAIKEFCISEFNKKVGALFIV
jgi:glycosyltransferase involved in cell wall biosynthesis